MKQDIQNTNLSNKPCPVCGSKNYFKTDVLWTELENEWQLSADEIKYVNRQQGFHCTGCTNNLRSMGLASAILKEYKFLGTLSEFCEAQSDLRLLEINAAGNLTKILSKLQTHTLIEYPQFDMHNLAIESESFDLVIHSDTLEHVTYPERALSECRRLLRNNGKCIFTVPIIVGRMSRSRAGLMPSYHGRTGVLAADQVVCTEFGADVWQVVLKAGFSSCEIYCYEYPASLVIIARK
jgi:SAM-dependent methyltransferase